MSGANTSYGTWLTEVDRESTTVERTVLEAFGSEGPPDGVDVDQLAADYREAINEALPEGVTLSGNEFYGPAEPAAGQPDGYLLNRRGELNVEAIVNDVDFWKIVGDHRDADQ